MKPSALTSMATSAFGATPGAAQLIDDGAAAARALGDVDLDREALEGQQGGIDDGGDREGIVHWCVVMPIDLHMEPPIEAVQIGDDRRRRDRVSRSASALAALSIARWVTSRPTIVTSRPR